MANLWASDGVIKGYLSELSATLNTNTNVVTVQPGGCFIHGYYAEIINAQTFTVAANGTIVAQVNFTNETAQIYWKPNAVDYGPSTTLNYEQSVNNWEIPLWLMSSNALFDLRTMINPGMGLAFWAWYQQGASITVPTNSTSTTAASFLTARVPFASPAILRGSAVVTFNNLATAQTAACSLVYQQGASDQYPAASATAIPQATPAVGGGGAATSISLPVSLSMSLPSTTAGRKTAGMIVTAGTGASIQVAQIMMSLELIGTPSIN